MPSLAQPRQEKVAKSVQCGEPDWTKVAGASSDDLSLWQAVLAPGKKDFEIVGAFADGQAIVEADAGLEPDICLLDISMPILSGIEVARRLNLNGVASPQITG